MHYSCLSLDLGPFTTLGSARLNNDKVEIHIFDWNKHQAEIPIGHHDRTTAKMTMGGRGDSDVENVIQGVLQVARYSLNSQCFDSVRGIIE
jgi:hypothetical protein